MPILICNGNINTKCPKNQDKIVEDVCIMFEI